jgi:hypothetical protein
MQEELNNFKRNEVWTLVPRPNQNVVGTKWVFRNMQDECWGEGEDATLRSMPSPDSLHQRRKDDWQTLPFVPRVAGRRPMTRLSHPATTSNMEAHA